MRFQTSGSAVAVLLISALHFVSGCASRPTTTLAGARITELTLEHVSVTFDVKVTNPWLVPLPLVEAAGDLASSEINNGAPFLNLAAGSTGTVPAQGSSTVSLSGTFTYLPVLATMTKLHAGDEVPYTARLQLTTAVPATSEKLKLPVIQHEGKLPFLAVPEVSVAGVSWPHLGPDQISGTITLRIKNRNKFAIGPGTADGRILLKNIRATGDTELSTFSVRMPDVIDALEQGTLALSVSFSPAGLFDAAAWSGLAQALGNPSNLRLTGTIQGSTPYTPVTLSFDTH